MLDIILPEIEQIVTDVDHARFKIEPLEPGWGYTLGNALRRILTNSLPGAAVTAVKLSAEPGADGRLPQIEEDIIDVILNTKQLRLRYRGDQPVRVHLKVDGKKGSLTAANLQLPEGVEVMNPDSELVHSTGSKGGLEIEMLVQQGFGYSPAEQHAEYTPFDMTPIDALYSPIPRLNYVVEHTRLGQRTDYDRLLLDIWTDGSIEPVEALRQAAQILTRHGQIVASFSGTIVEDEVEEVEEVPVTSPSINIPIEQLNLTSRTFNALKRAYIDTVGQVLTMTDNELLGLRNFGQKALDELREKLVERGLAGEAAANPLRGSLTPMGHEQGGDDDSGQDAPEQTTRSSKKTSKQGSRLTSLSELATLAPDLDSEDQDEAGEDEADKDEVDQGDAE